MSASSASRPSAVGDFKKDNDLAQWSSEIRKMQTEVDQETEEESRRLQQEIAASRLERERRRQSNRKSGVAPVMSYSSVKADEPSDDPLNTFERQKNQEDTLQKLMGTESTDSSASSRLTAVRSSQPMSLASIMGATSNGPRLNKPPPQATGDALFDAIARPPVTPGTGPRTPLGVALPGLQQSPAQSTATKPTPGARESPGYFSNALPSTAPDLKTTPEKISPATGKKPSWSPQDTKTPVTPSTPISPPTPTKPARLSSGPIPTPVSPPRGIQKPTSSKSVPSPKAPGPDESKDQQSPPPQPPFGGKPSPAFLRPLPTKELTPSLTRLQGRGFVARSVQAGGVASSIAEESTRKDDELSKGPTGKKVTVLDRWPAGSQTGSGSPGAAKSTSPSIPTSGRPLAPNRFPGRSEPSPSPNSQTSAAGRISPNLTRGPSSSSTGVALPGLSNGASWKAPPAKDISEGSAVQVSETIQRSDAASSSVPLSHPTKERARKPRKGYYNSNVKASAAPQPAKPAATSELTFDKPAVTKVAAAPVQPSLPKNDIVAAFEPPKRTPVLPERPQPFTASSPIIADDRPVTRPTSTKLPPRPSSEEKPGPPRAGIKPNVAKLAETWGANKPIGVKVVSAPSSIIKQEDHTPSNSAFRRALPGLAAAADKPEVIQSSAEDLSARKPSVAELARGMQASQPQPPSVSAVSAPRAAFASPEPEAESTPVDVRAVIANWGKATPTATSLPADATLRKDALPNESPEGDDGALDVKSVIATWGRAAPPSPVSATPPPSTPTSHPSNSTTDPPASPIKAERRRSNLHEKYASIILPPLKEEKTPDPTPTNSLARREPSSTSANGSTPGDTESSIKHKRHPSAFQMHQALLDHRALIDVVADTTPIPSPLPPSTTLPGATDDPLIQLAITNPNTPLPKFNLASISPLEHSAALPSDAVTVSVEIFNVSGKASAPVTSDPHIFYNVEVRAIVHRYKSNTSGLVTTRVFGWRGREAEVGAAEVKKLSDLATRFGTSLIPCIQGSEPVELVRVLGGRIITRQGPRAHWTRDNTTMHCVRELKGVVYIDEVEPERRNLCSAFSYVTIMLGEVYVFHGRGATLSERAAAVSYASSLCGSDRKPEEFEENNEAEMFTMVLGEEDHAKADFWKFKSVLNGCLAELYRVDGRTKSPVQKLEEVAAESIDPSAVFVLDGTFELFVIVGAEARGLRHDIRLALSVAEALAQQRSINIPFTPPIHVLILPSQIPMDLRAGHVRFMDEDLVNGGEVPTHMNLLHSSEAYEHLGKTAWPRSMLEHTTFLPLGVAPEDIPL